MSKGDSQKTTNNTTTNTSTSVTALANGVALNAGGNVNNVDVGLTGTAATNAIAEYTNAFSSLVKADQANMQVVANSVNELAASGGASSPNLGQKVSTPSPALGGMSMIQLATILGGFSFLIIELSKK